MCPYNHNIDKTVYSKQKALWEDIKYVGGSDDDGSDFSNWWKWKVIKKIEVIAF